MANSRSGADDRKADRPVADAEASAKAGAAAGRAANTSVDDDEANGIDWVGGGAEPGLTNLLFGVWLVSRATTALVDGALGDTGLDADEFAVYSVLRSGDGLKPSELADWMSAPATTVSSYVRRFENRGHVTRVPDPRDGRSYRVVLTDEGRQVHRAAAERFRPVLDAVTAEIGDEGSETVRRLGSLHRVVVGRSKAEEF